MNKLKAGMRKLWTKIKKHYYLSAGLGSLILLLILFSPIFHSNWLRYPDSLRIRIALHKLLESIEVNEYCREDCAIKQAMYENIITQSLSRKPDIYLNILENKILDPDLSKEARFELLKLCIIDEISVSKNIMDFYLDVNNDFEVRAQLAMTWPEIKSQSFSSEIIGRIKNSHKVSEKLDLLNMLNGQTDDLSLSLLWDIILNDDEDILKKKAFSILNNINDEKSFYNEVNLAKLKFFLEKDDYPPRMKDQAIYLLNNFYNFYPSQSESLLVEIANDEKYDKYQKTFAINILNKQLKSDYKLPELSQDDWEYYYKN